MEETIDEIFERFRLKYFDEVLQDLFNRDKIFRGNIDDIDTEDTLREKLIEDLDYVNDMDDDEKKDEIKRIQSIAMDPDSMINKRKQY